jgi:hypothetical protein
MRGLSACMRRANATVIAFVTRPLAHSMFRDLRREGTSKRVYDIEIASRSPAEVELAESALRLLSERQPRRLKVVVAWLQRLGFEKRFPWRKHFCDGTLFIESEPALPPDRLAAYIYRIAMENMLFRRFHKREILLNDARTKLIAYRRELDLMKQLGCSDSYMAEQQFFVQQYRDQNRKLSPPAN